MSDLKILEHHNQPTAPLGNQISFKHLFTWLISLLLVITHTGGS